jgi:hypothetical protein
MSAIKRGILRLTERAGYSVFKHADRERLELQAAEVASLRKRLVEVKTELTSLKEQLAQPDVICEPKLKREPLQLPLTFQAAQRAYDEAAVQLAEQHAALGQTYRLLGDRERADAHYCAALTYNYDQPDAHDGLALLRLAGDDYLIWLDRLYAARVPETVFEIGVGKGLSLARVRPPSIAIGIDPSPAVSQPLTAETHIFPETSDVFFARRRPEALLKGRPLSIGFIDGLHLYEQVVRDFINLEGHCGPRSIILMHDMIPLDEATQARAKKTQFYTGDVWKTVLCLKCYRPDLDIFTVATSPTGLTVVTGLDPASRVLADKFDEAVARFIDYPYAEFEDQLAANLNIVPNDWSVVAARLQARGIL